MAVGNFAAMALKVDHFASLSRAVAGLDRDSYAARGAIYDREHKALMRLLFTADPPRSDAEIEREQLAFRDAVRRIEFGDKSGQIALVAGRESAEKVGAQPATPARVPAPLAPAPAP